MLPRRDQRHEVVVVTNVFAFVLQVIGQDQKPQPGRKNRAYRATPSAAS
jgi:hypothetical protein